MILGLVLLLSLFVSTTSQTGSLKVESTPGTEVIWETVSLGKTDHRGSLLISEIPAGRFEVILHKEGFEEARRLVNIRADQDSLLRVTLVPLPAVDPNTAPSESPAHRPSASPRASDVGPAPTEELVPAEKEPNETPVISPGEPGPVQPAAKGSPPVWPLLLIPVLVILLVRLFRRFRSPAPVSAPPTLLSEKQLLAPPGTTPKTTSFLRDLKKREELLEQGVEIEPPKKRPVIDLDAESIREIEDQ
jgi:hypothetical protein